MTFYKLFKILLINIRDFVSGSDLLQIVLIRNREQ